jgi:hypothetical protein
MSNRYSRFIKVVKMDQEVNISEQFCESYAKL